MGYQNITVDTKMTAIADEIRTLSGTSAPMGLDTMASTLNTENANFSSNLTNQDGLISQIQNALKGKTSATTQVLQEKTVTPTNNFQVITPDSGYTGLKQVVVQGDPNLVPENILKGVSIFGVDGNAEASGSVGGLSQYTKIYATPGSNIQFTIVNPLGGLAKKVSIRCPADSTTETASGKIQRYTIDDANSIGVMKAINPNNGNTARYAVSKVSTITSNSQYCIQEGEIIVRSYNATTIVWDTSCEYEIEIWQ